MSDLVSFQSRVNDAVLTRAINPNLVTHLETLPQGGAAIYFMGGGSTKLDKDEWADVGITLLGSTGAAADQLPPPK